MRTLCTFLALAVVMSFATFAYGQPPNPAPQTGLIVVEVWHSESCPPCRAIEPVVRDLIQKGYAIRWIDVNVAMQKWPEDVRRRRIRVLPTALRIVGRRITARREGGLSRQVLEVLLTPLSPTPGTPTLAPPRETVIVHKPILLTPTSQCPEGRACARTRNFVVCSPNEQLSLKIAQAAEDCRRGCAAGWLGAELPDWPVPCNIHVRLSNGAGGGTTSLAFNDGAILGIDSTWEGSPQDLIENVTPHEVMHMILATKFGMAIPRWLDEGIAHCCEGTTGKKASWGYLLECLNTGRVISFSSLMNAREYPQDALPFYGESHWTCEFLAQRAGHQSLIDLLSAYNTKRDWNAALKSVYDLSLDDLSRQWNDWIRKGAPTHRYDVSKPQMANWTGATWTRSHRLFPYRAQTDAKIQQLQQAVRTLARNGPSSAYASLPAGSLNSIYGQLQQFDQRLTNCEQRQDLFVSEASKLSAKWDSELPGIRRDVSQAISESQAARGVTGDLAKSIDAALDDNVPTSRLGRLRAKIEDRFAGVKDKVDEHRWFFAIVGIALLVIVVMLLRRDGIKAAAGEQTTFQAIAARTSNPWDNLIADAAAAIQAIGHNVISGALSPLHTKIDNMRAEMRGKLKDRFTPEAPENPTQQ